MSDVPDGSEPTTRIPTQHLERLMDRLELDSGIVDMLYDAVVVARDDDGRILRTNTQAAILWGYRPEEFATMTVEDLLPERHRAAHRAHRLTRMQAGAARAAMGTGRVFPALKRDGTEVEVQVMLNSFRLHDGQVTVAQVRPCG